MFFPALQLFEGMSGGFKKIGQFHRFCEVVLKACIPASDSV
jgi:hypothetical protein